MARLRAPTPAHIAAGCMLTGVSASVAGVYVLWGLGWSLIAAGIPLLCLGLILIQGLSRVGE